MVYNGYYKVMSNSPKMGHLPIPVLNKSKSQASVVGLDSESAQRSPHVDPKNCSEDDPRWEEVLFNHWLLG